MTSELKKFVFKIFILALPILFLILFVEYRLYKIENSYSFKDKNIKANLNSIEVVNLGSSHGNMGLNPYFYNYNGFNMANVSQSLYYDYHIFNNYINDAKSLKVVILPISYFSLGFKLIDSQEYWREFFYSRFYNIPLENNSKLMDLRNYSIFELYGHNYSKSYIRNNFNINLAENFNKKGAYIESKYDLESFMKNINYDSGKIRADFHNKIFNIGHISDNLLYIENIIKTCKEKKITLIIITTPTYKTYYQNINKEIWNLTQEKIKYLQNIYNIKYYDYLKDERFKKEDFRDNDHLNPKGAEKFSQIVNQEILKLHIK